ncbi:hydroxymethylglutaryl-CoA lyase [Pseudalkalibacillus caeni]|uniref:Hydroxymethylglutaryl-CoA lyase n=1 Tax=Exobacillus caeni TaxID=2574798 RepID=A0A5R9EYL5_9BACL|nr:hydroxymethylglutaryl-CoA lyase [Pseudalkalibacillus caeni]TLS36247.1 hydroxymethylglutaryl-CoA lyase [Pseudalkalibacillus caeni]
MIEVCEVGPRDGLQNEKEFLSTDQKVQLINRLINSGIRKIEAVSFVNPKVVPQMADAEEVMKLVPYREDVSYAGLVLSRSGLDRALLTKIDTVNIVLATSDQFNLKNARRTVEQSQDELIPVIKEAKEANRKVAGVLGTVFGCPYEGEVSVEKVLHISESFIQAGCEEIVLADTTGMANPQQVTEVTQAFKQSFGDDFELRLHFHNTRGLGLANVLAAYQAGVTAFDSSIAGLGGCPFAPKAVGNVCTEDMVNMFHQMKIDTGIDLSELIKTSLWMEKVIGRPLPGMISKAEVV